MRIIRLLTASILGYLLGTVPSADIASRLVSAPVSTFDEAGAAIREP